MVQLKRGNFLREKRTSGCGGIHYILECKQIEMGNVNITAPRQPLIGPHARHTLARYSDISNHSNYTEIKMALDMVQLKRGILLGGKRASGCGGIHDTGSVNKQRWGMWTKNEQHDSPRTTLHKSSLWLNIPTFPTTGIEHKNIRLLWWWY